MSYQFPDNLNYADTHEYVLEENGLLKIDNRYKYFSSNNSTIWICIFDNKNRHYKDID